MKAEPPSRRTLAGGLLLWAKQPGVVKMVRSVGSLSRLAEAHWAEFLPQKTADLKEAGTFEMRAKQAAERAMAEIQALVSGGMPEDEAEEMVLPEYVLLKPEPKLV